MKKIGERVRRNRKLTIQLVLAIALIAAIATAAPYVGRFTPTHKIVEPVYCGACHPEQVEELSATTHLPHFAGAVYEEAEAIMAGGTAETTQAEAVAGGCMMCHNTWANRELFFVNGYSLTTDSTTGNTKVVFNDVTTTRTNKSILYDVAVNTASGDQFQRLGTNITPGKTAIYVQDPGSSGLIAGSKLNNSEFTTNSTGATLLASAVNVTLLNGTGTVRIEYQLNSTEVRSLTEMWGELSALSPTQGAFRNDQAAASGYTCGNPEKAMCHAIETAVGKGQANLMAENGLGARGSGVYFAHEMAYTSVEYSAKQVKLCAVCHVNKLPPMNSDGTPISQIGNTPPVIRVSHGEEILNTTTMTVTSSDWAHKQIQCIRCHSHAGIGSGVESP